VPARWGFALVASSTDLKTIETIKIPDFCAQVGSLPPGTPINPDGTLPDGVVLPDGSTLPPGTVVPPGVDQKQIDQFCHPDLPKSDPLWKHSTGTWLLDFAMLVLLGTLGIALVAVLLRRLEPKRRAGRPAPGVGPPPARVG
jgi:hypothetical protein